MFSINDYGFVSDEKTGFQKNGKWLKSKPYRLWYNIISRCYDKNNCSYKNYGAKGIYVCDEWKLYSNFRKWFDENYIEGYELDKDISGKGYYGPDSCMFISKKENVRESNLRRSDFIRSGEEHFFAKEKEYYSKNPVARCEFKKSCKRKGWNFDDFIEIDSKEKSSNRSIKKYYIYKGELNDGNEN